MVGHAARGLLLVVCFVERGDRIGIVIAGGPGSLAVPLGPMNAAVASIEVPGESEICRRLAGAQFHDCYVVQMPSEGASALELYLRVVSKTPGWVNRLMALRNKAVVRVGLKDLGHLGALDPAKPISAYRVGDRVGIFSVLYLTPKEVILGDSDKHLDVQVSVCKLASGGLAVSTVVHIHNMLGRAYMLVVAPVHKVIVRAMLKRLVLLGTATCGITPASSGQLWASRQLPLMSNVRLGQNEGRGRAS